MLLLALGCSGSAIAKTNTKTTTKTTKTKTTKTKTTTRTTTTTRTKSSKTTITTKASTPTFIMTEDGLDAIKLGMDFKTLPLSVAGLYDSYEVEKDGISLDNPEQFEFYSISFIFKGDSRFVALAHKNGEIFAIHNYGFKRLKAKIGDTLIGVGSKFSTLKNLPGAKECESFGEIRIGKFKFTQDIGMEEITDRVAYFILDPRD